jgi:hypothetical protein
MNAADTAAPSRQCHIDCFGIQPRLHLGVGQRITASIERRLDPLLGGIDDSALSLALFRRELAQALHLLSDLPGLTEVLGFRVLQGCRVFSSREIVLCLDYKLF